VRQRHPGGERGKGMFDILIEILRLSANHNVVVEIAE